jgi:deoxyadenosine/deoxycytidine kinase
MSLDINMTFDKEKVKKVHDILQDPTRKIIVVDGVIGAGKTTTIREIEKRFNKIYDYNEKQNEKHNEKNNENKDNIKYKKPKIKAIYEPVEIWKSTGALEYFYEDIPKNAYAFQTFTYITRISSVIDEIYDNPDADIYILERSIWTDRYIFMELLKDSITDLEMCMYNKWCDMWAYILPISVDKWVLLNTSLEESLKRIASRNRDGELEGITVEYQTNLYKKHIEFYDKLKNDGKPVVIIESNIMDENFIDNDEKVDDIISKIMDIDTSMFKIDKNNNENEKPSIISWLLDLI